MDVSEILERVDIVEYIGQYVDLTQKGREWWGLSPFTQEHTPSFSVDPKKQCFKDFSSGAGGNLIEFMKLYHKVTVHEAIRMLKAYAGITDDDEQDGMVKRLQATGVAKRFRVHEGRQSKSTAKALPQNVMSQYEFDLTKLKLWMDEGISEEVLRLYQVRYDAFDDRIVYPIHDFDGKIISVKGRTCDPEYKAKGFRKYTYYQQVGSLDTLFAWHMHADAIREAKEIILFEGEKSCMKMETWGIANTAALLTSHLSPVQMRFLIRLASYHHVRMVFALDSDVDIRQDRHIQTLAGYARVEWVRNMDNILADKEAPVDRGLEMWQTLYEHRVRLNG